MISTTSATAAEGAAQTSAANTLIADNSVQKKFEGFMETAGQAFENAKDTAGSVINEVIGDVQRQVDTTNIVNDIIKEGSPKVGTTITQQEVTTFQLIDRIPIEGRE